VREAGGVHSGGFYSVRQIAAEDHPTGLQLQGGGQGGGKFNQMNAARGGKFRGNLDAEIP
jgi:hypothetical protein